MEPNTTLPKTPTIRIYTALLTQSGTAAPTAIVLQNTLGADVTWTRSAAGVYIGTCNGKFIDGKITLLIAQNFGGGERFSIYGQTSPNSISVETQDFANVKMDDLLYNNFVEVKLYQ